MASIAGTCTITEINSKSDSMKRIHWDVLGGSSASVNSITSPTTSGFYNGKLQVLHCVGAAGNLPSASYDITILDGSSVDVLAGAGASQAQALEHTVGASLGAVCNSKLTLTIANVGSANGIDVYLYVR